MTETELSDLQILKKEYRRRGIRGRDAVCGSERVLYEERIAAAVLSMPEYQSASVLLVYCHVRGEVSVDLIREDALRCGKTVVYPRCVSGTEMQALLPEDEGAWAPGSFHIPEPVPERSSVIRPEQIDMVIVPCAAFTQTHKRVGMGAGYYDRYLPLCTRACKVMTAFGAQRVEDFEQSPYDYRPECLATECGLHRL